MEDLQKLVNGQRLSEYTEALKQYYSTYSANNVIMESGDSVEDIIGTLKNDYDNQFSQVNVKFDEADDKFNQMIIKFDNEVGAKLGLSIDPQTYVMTISLISANNTVLDTKTVDLPLETMVVNASCSGTTLTLTLQNGTTVDVNVSSIVSGLVPTSRKIAGIDLADDITVEELKRATGSLVAQDTYLKSLTINPNGTITRNMDVVDYSNYINKSVFEIVRDNKAMIDTLVTYIINLNNRINILEQIAANVILFNSTN